MVSGHGAGRQRCYTARPMKRLKLCIQTAAVVLALALPCAAAAQIRNAQDLTTTRALAMGDAFRAIATSNEGIYFNLAGLAQVPRYEVDLVYLRDETGDLNLYNGSIVDGKSTAVATGLAYSRLSSGGLDGHVVNLGFGLPLGHRAFLGFGLKYLNFSDPEETNSITGDLGLIIQPVDLLAIGITTYNVIDVHSSQAPRRAAIGAALGSDSNFHLASDVVFDFSGDDTELTFHAGAEYLLVGEFPLRAGFKRHDATGDDYLSAGLGWISPEFALEGAYVQNIGEGRGEDHTFSFTFKFFL